MKLRALEVISVDEITFVNAGDVFEIADPEVAIKIVNDGRAVPHYGADVAGPDDGGVPQQGGYENQPGAEGE